MAAVDTKTSAETVPETAPEQGAAESDLADSDDFEFGKFDDDTTPATVDEHDENQQGQDDGKGPAKANEEIDEGPDKESKQDDATSQEIAPVEEVPPPKEEEADKKITSPKNVPKDRANQVEAEVVEAFFEWTNQWNSGNLFGFLDAYWDSDQLRYVSEMLENFASAKGQVVIGGRSEVDKIFTDIFVKNKKRQERYKDNMKKGVAGIMCLRKIIVTPTGMKDAIVFGERQMEVAGDKRGTYIGIVFTVHVRKMAGQWKIVSEHATAHPKK